MATRKKVEQRAAAHNITIEFAHWREFGGRCYQYSVDLPDGMITEDGNTGKYAEESDSDHTAAEIWDYILADVEDLIERKWITLTEYEAAQVLA